MADETTPPAPIDHRAQALRCLQLSADTAHEEDDTRLTLVALVHAVLHLSDRVGSSSEDIACRIADLFVTQQDGSILVRPT